MLTAPCSIEKMCYIKIAIDPYSIALLKYYLEAEDNLGYLRVLDRKYAYLYAIAPLSQKEELSQFLSSCTDTFPSLKILE